MKKVLITGTGSFVGNSVLNYLERWPEKYDVTAVDTKSDAWKSLSFSNFDTVYHVAGLAHSDSGRVSEEKKAFYYKINTDLAVNVAQKAKIEGVKQFIFMSSAIVYGDSAPIKEDKIITRDTPCNPANFYGDSKVQAENSIKLLADKNFKVVILRCPMIYGKGGKGNFPTLEKIALASPLFPKVKNARSMLYIGNLTEFVRLMIENEEEGTFWPCNKEWSNTSELVQMIGRIHGKKIILVPGVEWILDIISHATGLIDKAFGNFAYEIHLGDYKEEYRLYTLEESIEETEG